MRFKFLSTRNAVLIITSVLLAIALAFGINMLPKTALAVDDNEAEAYAHTFILGASGTDTDTVHYYEDMSAGWTAVKSQTQTQPDGKVLVKLEDDWKTSTFIDVRYGDVTLDLNGHVIDRGLTNVTSNGVVVYVMATLTITDSNPNAEHIADGKPVYTYDLGTADETKLYLTKTVETAVTGGIITGGYSKAASGGIGGGVYVYKGGNLTMDGGTIYGNTTASRFGGGVYLGASTKFTMNGGGIIKNAVKYGDGGDVYVLGGGVAMYGAGGEFTMNGGIIADNVCQNTSATGWGDARGGGVGLYGTAASPAEFKMTGGTINNNRTISADISDAQSVGGAIYTLYATLDISDGEISDNRALQVQNGVEGFYNGVSYGAAIGCSSSYNNISAGKEITISGGLITRNMAYYGTINAYGDQFYTGGKLVYNSAVGNIAGIRFNNGNSSIEISGAFEYHDNYTLDSNNAIYFDSSFEMPYEATYTNNDPKNDSHDFYVGKLNEGVSRLITVTDWVLDRNIGLSLGYTDNNSAVYTINGEEYKIPVNPNKYFESGRPTYVVTVNGVLVGVNGTGKIVLNSEGEVAFASTDREIVFTVHYSDGTKDIIDYDNSDYYGIAVDYTKTITSLVFNEGKANEQELDISAINGLGMYEFTAQIGADIEVTEEDINNNCTELYTVFYVVVQPKEITDDDDKFVAEFGMAIYNGAAQTPAPVSPVTYDGVELEESTDYTLRYENNYNVSDKAKAIFTFTGNYSGEVTKYFTIAAQEIVYSMNWQYRNGEDWVTFDGENFVYNGEDQSGSIRAALTTDSDATVVNYTYVYAQNVEVQNTTGLYLQISGTYNNESVDRILNATKYTVTVVGAANYTLPDNHSVTVTVNPQTITFDPSDYDKDDDSTRLWQLKFGESTTSSLRDSVTYIVTGNDGDQAVTGTLKDAYARFRNQELTLVLNNYYKYNGNPISYYTAIADVTYANNKATGTEKGVTEVITEVTFKFNGNFNVGTDDNSITLTKNWYIVTINNGLLNGDGTGEATLPEFTYGEKTTVQPFLPEHGNTVYFTFRQGSSVKWRVAVRYSNNYASKTFYNFTVVEGTDGADDSYVLIDVMPDSNYFATVINHLDAGRYQLDAHINGFTDEDEVVYYTVDRTFTFTVNAYDIKTGETAKRVGYEVTTPELVFSNSAKAPEVTVTFDGNVLVYGTDYTVTTASVNAGAAVAQINGIGNFSGSIEVAFTITKANNEWQSAPNIIRWVYGGFNSSINVITSLPMYMSAQESVAYTVLDSNKQVISSILTNFHVENGVATVVVANELAKLDSGTYYLVASLDGSDNYHGLDTSANPLEFNVIKATNGWAVLPDVIEWSYNNYSATNNVILGTPYFGTVTYLVKDSSGNELTSEFTLTEDGNVPDEVIKVFDTLGHGTYTLFASVGSSGNYGELNETVTFVIAKAGHVWEETPSITSWVKGDYNETENGILFKDIFGNTAISENVNILIYDANLGEDDINDENVVYKVVNGEVIIDNLAKADVGHYILKVTVNETANYFGAEKTFNFQIFAPEGLAWWVWLLIIVGILGVIAIVFVILHEKGVLQMLTGKFVIAMRTKMTVDATIAAVRANMVAERSAKTRAEAQKRDKIEELRKAREEAKQRPADEQAAALEEQASITAKRAERMQKRAESMQKRADKMRAQVGEAEAEQEAAATDETDSTEE